MGQLSGYDPSLEDQGHGEAERVDPAMLVEDERRPASLKLPRHVSQDTVTNFLSILNFIEPHTDSA